MLKNRTDGQMEAATAIRLTASCGFFAPYTCAIVQ
jgi:hypothetical protein